MILFDIEDDRLKRMMKRYVTALVEEGRIPRDAAFVICDDPRKGLSHGEKTLLVITDSAEGSRKNGVLSLPCRREALAEAITHRLTS